MRIVQLELDGVGPFEEATFDFPAPEPEASGELVLFEGPNGSGKTTLLLAIAVALRPHPPLNDQNFLEDRDSWKSGAPFFWHRRMREKPRGKLSIEDAQKTQSIWYRGRQWTAGWPSTANEGDVTVWPSVDKWAAARVRQTPTDWAAYSFASHQSTPHLAVRGPLPIEEDYLNRALYFGHSKFGRIERLAMGEGLASEDPLSSHGGPPLGQLLSNLDYDRARAIAYGIKQISDESQKRLYEAAAASYDETLLRMQAVLSELLDRRVEFRFVLDQAAPSILFDGEQIHPETLGEGLRSTFSWIADLFVQLQRTPWVDKKRSPFDQDFWLLLDEVDQSLHPQMQMRLMPSLRKLFPRARIYATTHSPFVVASVGEGYVFSIVPDRDTRKVRGPQVAQKLEPGQTLERVVSEVFKSPSLFIDAETRSKLATHEQAILALRAKRQIDWPSFLSDRAWLMARTDEVRTVAAMREVPVRQIIEARLREAHE